MNKHFKALEFDKILLKLAEYTTFSDARELALATEPAEGLFEARELLNETSDAHSLSGRFGSPAFGNLHNMNSSLRRAEAGATLTTTELLRIAALLRSIQSVCDWRSRSAGVETVLDMRFNALSPQKYLENKISSAILSEEEIADHASTELFNIRRKISASENKIRERLDKAIHSASMQKYLQESIITTRGGRFVIPVKAEFRSNIPGLVHDTSSSGSTVFIEPMSVVEANNEIRVLRSKEQAEIERILAELSAEAGAYADPVCDSFRILTELNVIFARSQLAYSMKASIPKLNAEGKILLHKARHPLIDPQKVVPTDIELGINFDTLVITGPNTGGKTVSLKTVGLLTLMAMCGFMVPAGDNSELSVFDSVLADIGDGGFLLLLDGDAGIFHQPGTFLTCLILGFLYDGITGLSSLFQNLSLLLACLLQDGFTFFLYIGEPFVGLMRLAQRVVDESLTLLHHPSDDGEAKLPQQEEHHEERNAHPEQQTSTRNQ